MKDVLDIASDPNRLFTDHGFTNHNLSVVIDNLQKDLEILRKYNYDPYENILRTSPGLHWFLVYNVNTWFKQLEKYKLWC